MSNSRFATELMRGCAELVVLALLRRRPMYGYEIMVSLREVGDGQFQLKQGTLYPLLYRLEREGYIKAKWETPAKGKKRKVYSITGEGKATATKQTSEWTRLTHSVNSILKEINHG